MPKKLTRKRKKSTGKWSKSHVLLLIFISIIGLALRLGPVFRDTVHFSYDQGVDLALVRTLINDHKLSLIGRFTGLQGVFMGPYWTFALAIPYVISGGNPAASVIVFFASGSSCYMDYLLDCQEMLDERVDLSCFICCYFESFRQRVLTLFFHPALFSTL